MVFADGDGWGDFGVWVGFEDFDAEEFFGGFATAAGGAEGDVEAGRWGGLGEEFGGDDFPAVVFGEFFEAGALLVFEVEDEVVDEGVEFDLFFAAFFGEGGGFFGAFLIFGFLGGGFGFVAGCGFGEGFLGFVFGGGFLGEFGGGDDVGEFAEGLGGEGVLDGFPVGFDFVFGGLDFGFVGVELDLGEVDVDLLVVEGEGFGDDVAVCGEAGADEGVEFFGDEDVGCEVADVAFGHAHAAEGFVDEGVVFGLVEGAVLVGEGAHGADVGGDFLVGGVDAEFFGGIAEDHAADEELFRGFVFGSCAGGEAHEELIESEVAELGEALGEVEAGCAEA